MPRVLVALVLALAACRVELTVAALGESATSTAMMTTTTGAEATTDAPTTGATTGAACEFDGVAACEGVNDPFRAIGLGCAGTPITAPVVTSDEPGAYRVATQFGNAYWGPREGAQLLVLTTGSLPIPDANGYVQAVAGSGQPGVDNAGENGVDLPPPIEPFPGSEAPWVGCDGENDCSHSLPDLWENGTGADAVGLSFSVTAPAGAAGFALDVAWMSAEFPERAELPDGDLAVVWVSAEGFTGNLATVGGAALVPMHVRGQVVEGQRVGDHPSLAGTGMEGVEGPSCDFGWAAYTSCPRGGALEWMTLRGPASAGEVVAVTVLLMDRQDALLDSLLLLDAWRWTCEGCALGSTCGLGPA